MGKLTNAQVDEMVRLQYEDALGDGEEWAEEAFVFRSLLQHLNSKHVDQMQMNSEVGPDDWVDMHEFLHELMASAGVEDHAVEEI